MRNLKRALSLTLASVMLLGMMVVGSSAAGFPDVDDTKNVEAIEVLQAVAVMVGDKDTGNFRPDAPVSRAEMAVIMSNLLGLTTSYYVSTCPFEDVSGSYSWARGPVGAAYASKVLSGRTATTFDPAATVTAVEAASMIMRGLGYFQHTGDFADGFNVATVRQANLIGLFSGIKGDATTPLTRNQVAQMALNALQANIVDFTGTPGIKFDGVEVGYKAEYTPRTSPDGKYAAIGKLVSNIGTTDQYYVQLGEELYDGDLRLDDTTDAFGAPARRWSYKSEEIGTYAKNELLHKEYSTKVTGRDLYDLLGANVIKGWDIYVAIDGETDPAVNGLMFDDSDMTRNNNEGVGDTDKGVLTQVYMDTTNKEVYIVVINTYLAIATEDYDSKNEDVQLDVYALNTSSVSTSKAPDYIKDRTNEKISVTVENEDIDVSGVKEDDKFLVTVADGNVQTMVAPEIMDSVSIESFKKKANVTVDGEDYDYAHTAMYDVEVLDEYSQTNLKDTTYNIVLDKYGYLIGIEQNQDPDQYVFLTGMEGNGSDLSTKNADANVIRMDGTMETVSVNVGKSKLTTANGPQMNTWCTYSVDSKGIYTLKEVATAFTTDVKVAQSAVDADTYTNDEIKIDKKNVSLPGVTGSKVYGNNDTVYLAVSTEPIKAATNAEADPDQPAKHWHAVINDVDSVTVGARNASLVAKQQVAGDGSKKEVDNVGDTDGPVVSDNEVYPLFKDNGYIIAAVVIGEDDGVSKSFAYIHSDSVKRERYNKTDDEWTWVREAIVNGKIVDLTEVGGGTDLSTLKDLEQGKWYELKFDADNNVKGATEQIFTGGTTGTAEARERIDEVLDVEPSVNAHDTVILQQTGMAGGANSKLTYKNGTLYTTEDQSKALGFSVSPDVKVVLCLSDGEGTDWDDCDDDYTGYAGLERAIRNLDSNFVGELNAVFDSGDAVVIILVDTTDAEDVDDDDDDNNAETNAKAVVDIDRLEITELNVVDGDYKAPIIEAVKKLGYTVSDWSGITAAGVAQGDTVVVKDADGNTSTLEITGTPVKYWTVKVDNVVKEEVEDGEDSVLVVSDITGKGTGYLADGTYADYDPTDDTTAAAASVSDAVVIETGYVEVANVTAAAVATGATTGATAGTVAITGTPTFAKVGSKLAVTVTTTANSSATTGSTVGVTVTGATAPATKDITLDQVKAGATVSFEIVVEETEITAVGGTIADKT